MEAFQIIGDLHLYVGSNRPPPTPLPTAKYLIITGDIIQPYTNQAFAFYTHCAKNWERTFIIMGNQEYEASAHMFPFSMEYHEAYMRHLIQSIDSRKLVFIQNGFAELPELNLRIAGLTLWTDGAQTTNLRKTTRRPKTYSLTQEGDTCVFKSNLNLRFTQPVTQKTNEFSFSTHGHPPGVRNPFEDDGCSDVQISQDDLRDIQSKEAAFVEKMIAECKDSGYALLVVSHFIPTMNVIPESPNVSNYIDPFPFNEYCRDMTQYLNSPICAWVCGHIHHEQKVGIVHINCDRIDYSAPPNFL